MMMAIASLRHADRCRGDDVALDQLALLPCGLSGPQSREDRDRASRWRWAGVGRAPRIASAIKQGVKSFGCGSFASRSTGAAPIT
jgi:hypothetical protein